jgi:hypothetical protein
MERYSITEIQYGKDLFKWVVSDSLGEWDPVTCYSLEDAEDELEIMRGAELWIEEI